MAARWSRVTSTMAIVVLAGGQLTEDAGHIGVVAPDVSKGHP
jgi:hypothetical protein